MKKIRLDQIRLDEMGFKPTPPKKCDISADV